MSTQRLSLAAGAILALCIVAWVGPWRSAASSRPALLATPSNLAAEEGAKRDSRLEKQDEVSSAGESQTAVRSEESTRNALGSARAARLQGRVIDTQGRPIAQATVGVNVEQATWRKPALARDPSANLAAGIQAMTGSDGSFDLELRESGSGVRTFVWASHPDFVAAGREWDGGLLEPLVLTAGAGVRVQVVDVDGRPRAEVELFTFLPDEQSEGAAPDLSPELRAAFVRSARTDGGGRASLPAGPGAQHVTVRAGEESAAPWYGPAPADIRLVLSGTVSVSGRVRWPAGFDRHGELRITALARSAMERRALGRAEVTADGQWGALRIARQEGADLLLRLDGADLLPIEKALAFPDSGGRLFVDFEAQSALVLPIRFEDDLGRPVVGAHVGAWWQEGDEWRQAQAAGDGEGFARLAVRPGWLWIRGRASGHQQVELGAFEQLVSLLEPIVLRLPRAGRIAGRVLRDSEPVPSYTLKFWGTGGTEIGSESILDRADGAFEVDRAPLGELAIVAMAEVGGSSEIVRVRVDPDDVARVELHLRATRSGRGRVVDAFSGEPIESAVVRPWIRDGPAWIAPTGAEVRCDGDGAFVLDELGPGANHLEVSAPGYAGSNGFVEVGDDRELVEVGTFALVRSQTLTVELEGRWGADWDSLRVRLPRAIPPREGTPSSDGIVVFPAHSGGATFIEVEQPDGVRTDEFAYLTAGQPWHVRIALESVEAENVDVELRGSEPPPPGWWIASMTTPGSDGWRGRRVPILAGRARVPGPFGEHVALELIDPSARVVAVRHLTRGAALSRPVVFELDEPQRPILVVDGRDEPLPDVQLIVAVPGSRSAWAGSARTDSRGRAVICLPPDNTILFHVLFPGGGGKSDIRPDFPADPHEPLRVRVEVDSALRVRLEDRGTPALGVAPALRSPSGFRFLYLSHSGPDGVSESGPIPSGSYTLDVFGQGYWESLVPIAVGPGGTEVTIPIRRLGGLDLRVVGAEGLPVAGSSWILHSAEFETDVADWVRKGRVLAGAEGMVSGAEGTLSLSGLPNGPYRYFVRAPDGRTAGGELEVPPHARTEVTATLP